jgi:hypothetical protein
MPTAHTALHTPLPTLVQTFERQGFAPLQDRYLATWLHTGQQVSLEEGESPPGAALLPGCCTAASPRVLSGGGGLASVGPPRWRVAP